MDTPIQPLINNPDAEIGGVEFGPPPTDEHREAGKRGIVEARTALGKCALTPTVEKEAPKNGTELVIPDAGIQGVLFKM